MRALAWMLSLALLGACGGGGSGDGGALEESGSPQTSSSSSFWLNSGGRFHREGAGGRTIQGELPEGDPWRAAYRASSPTATDDGRHPQNLFRLVTQSSAVDARARVTFVVRATNRSASPARNASNGVFLFLRYRDGDHLYVAGVRVDGQAAIKKKVGTYRTLAIRPLFEGSPGAWSRDGNANLIPEGRPISLTAEVVGDPPVIRLFVDGALVLETVDGASPAIAEGRSGIRSDFMDVEFSDFAFEPLD